MAEKVSPEMLRPYRVDLQHDVFSELRRTFGFVYDDVLDSQTDASCKSSEASLEASNDASDTAGDEQNINADQTVFWPGCTLSSYSKELTDAAFDFLKEHGIASKMSAHCCGHILEFAAPNEDRQLYQGDLCEQLQAQGIKRIVTACPNCFYSFKRLIKAGTLPEIEIIALSETFLNEGIRFSAEDHPQCGSVCFHDSCPDRLHGLFAQTARDIFDSVELREMEHSRKSSRCCGLGYLLYLRQPERSAAMGQERVMEFIDSGADCLVTYCTNCASALYDSSETLKVYYYLELLFGIRMDWSSIFKTVAEVHGRLMAEESSQSS